GRVYQVLGEWDKALKAFLQAVAVFDRLVRDCPDDATYPRELAQAFSIIAENYYLAGRPAEANADFRLALTSLQRANSSHPTAVESYWQLAYALCVWLDPPFRDPTAALWLAQKAIELAPLGSRSWMVLGVAYYRVGQWQAAIEALQKALQSAEQVRSWDWRIAV